MYSDSDPYEAAIPYFARVRITPIREEHETSSCSNLVEFNMKFFGSFAEQPIDDLLDEAELGVDWTFADMGIDYDWNEFFQSNRL